MALWRKGYKYVGGIDEAGRGAWAGPVFAAIVVLSSNDSNPVLMGNVRDSKQMTPAQRDRWCPIIKEQCLEWGIGYATNAEIDTQGIVPATRLAIQRALVNLKFRPDILLLDYLTIPDVSIPQRGLIRGDQQVLSISAASVLAKTARDKFMIEMDGIYPGYSFRSNKGYGTLTHRRALAQAGVCHIHRISFKPISVVKHQPPVS